MENNKNHFSLIKKFVDILKNASIIIGIILIIVGIILDIPFNIISSGEPGWGILLKILSLLCSTVGATFFSVALINLIFEQWRMNEMENKIQSIPQSVIDKIDTSIIQISQNIITKFNPCIPYKIFPPGHLENDPIVNCLKDSLEKSDGKYYYTGIEMSTMAKAIRDLTNNLYEAYFFIPNPQKVKGLTADQKKNMAESIKVLINTWECIKQIKMEFILLNYIPSFHIHKTGTDCWFAFLDKGPQNGQQRQKFPATYQYKKNRDKSDDNYEMYHTIADTVDKLYGRHQNGVNCIKYTFMQGQCVNKYGRDSTVDVTCQKDNKIAKADKNNFFDIFKTNE